MILHRGVTQGPAVELGQPRGLTLVNWNEGLRVVCTRNKGLLPVQVHTELDVSRIKRAVNGAEEGIRIYPRGVRRKECIWNAELGMVEDVERFRSELQDHILRQPEILGEGGIGIGVVWGTGRRQRSWRIPKRVVRRICERARIEPLVDTSLGSGQRRVSRKVRVRRASEVTRPCDG